MSTHPPGLSYDKNILKLTDNPKFDRIFLIYFSNSKYFPLLHCPGTAASPGSLQQVTAFRLQRPTVPAAA